MRKDVLDAFVKALARFNLACDEVEVPEGGALYIASGIEFACTKLVCRGKVRVEGKLKVI